MEGAKRGADEHRQVGQVGKDLLEHVTLVLEVPADALVRRAILGIPGLAVDAVQTPQAQPAGGQTAGEESHHPEVLPLVETAHRSREDEHGLAGVAEVQQLHLSAERVAPAVKVLALHCRPGSLASEGKQVDLRRPAFARTLSVTPVRRRLRRKLRCRKQSSSRLGGRLSAAPSRATWSTCDRTTSLPTSSPACWPSCLSS